MEKSHLAMLVLFIVQLVLTANFSTPQKENRLTQLKAKYLVVANNRTGEKRIGDSCQVTTVPVPKEMDECIKATLTVSEGKDGNLTVPSQNWINVLECVGGNCSCLQLAEGTPEQVKLFENNEEKVCILQGLKQGECVDQKECADGYSCLPEFIPDEKVPEMYIHSSLRFCTAGGSIYRPSNLVCLGIASVLIYLCL